MRDSGKSKGIRLDAPNIKLGRAGGLEAALRELKQGNVYVGIMQETKLTDGIHVQQGAGYSVWVTSAVIRH